MVSGPLFTLDLASEPDASTARRAARSAARRLGLTRDEEARFGLAVALACRAAREGSGRIELSREPSATGEAVVARITLGRPAAPGAGPAAFLKELVDGVDEEGDGSVLLLRMALHDPPDEASPARLEDALPAGPADAGDEELGLVLDEMGRRGDELARLKREIEDTNRGVVALYAELDDKAERLRHADEMKSRFLSNMSHEFRTPLNSIMALARLLEDRTDGELSPEQDRQVRFIRKAAEALSELVNDLLDLARVEAGRVVVHPSEFEVSSLFGALRGLFRPLVASDAVQLVFEDPEGLPPLYSDESRLAQILRNLVSNALKFTERGEVRVSAALAPGGREVVLSVADTGIGIDPGDHERIFKEFGQVDGPLQRRLKGTGLGLPLSRRLTEILGGTLLVRSERGKGATFLLTLPLVRPSAAPVPGPEADWALVVDDEPAARYVLAARLAAISMVAVEAGSASEGLARARAARPRAVFLDLILGDGSGFEVLEALRADPATRDVPVVVVTSKSLLAQERARLEELGAQVLAKGALARPEAVSLVRNALSRAGWSPASAASLTGRATG